MLKSSVTASLLVAVGIAGPALASDIDLKPIGSYASGIFDGSGAEIPAYDPTSQRLFVTNSGDGKVDVLNLADPTNPTKLFSIDAPGVNSVAVNNGLVAIATEAAVKQDPGSVLFFDTDGSSLGSVGVGALPDMLTFTPDGTKLLVANEGEPDNYNAANNDPEGSVSIIDVNYTTPGSSVVTSAGFTAFNGTDYSGTSVRVFGPNATVAQDFEPEYITVAPDGSEAFISLQENNAIAVLDLDTNTITEIQGLGFKDHSLPGNELDASDRDGGINITNEPLFGMPQPDAIASYRVGSTTYYVTANEGDARDYDGFNEESRVKGLTLDGTAFSNPDLGDDDELGRKNVTTTLGDIGGDGDYEELYAFGTRSFSIYDEDGTLIFDSGADFETITAATAGVTFNANNDENDSFESRSDNKGPEPEGLVLGEIDGKTYAFIGLERVGGIMVYDVTDPENVLFEQYINPRDFTLSDSTLEDDIIDLEGTVAQSLLGDFDLGPEGLLFIDGVDSPNGQPLLVVTNEVSGTTTVYAVPEPTTLALAGLGLAGFAVRRRRKA